MTKTITQNDRHAVFIYLMDTYSRHFLAQNLALEMPEWQVEYYLKQIEEDKKCSNVNKK